MLSAPHVLPSPRSRPPQAGPPSGALAPPSTRNRRLGAVPIGSPFFKETSRLFPNGRFSPAARSCTIIERRVNTKMHKRLFVLDQVNVA